MALKLRICVRFASTFNVERVAVLTYDLVICKDSNDCLSYTYVLLMKLGGGGSTYIIDIHCIHAKWKGVGEQVLVHGGGRGVLPPLENEKKSVSKEILISFTYILLMRLGGGGIGIRVKWKGVGGQVRVQGREGRGGVAPPPLGNNP